MEEQQVDNKDRHLCKTCKYKAKTVRQGNNLGNGCNYCLITNNIRGCKLEHCTKYEKGRQIKIKRQINV